MNASTLGTAQILLNSANEHFPNGLANSSGAVGRYLMDHVMGPFTVGIFNGLKNHDVQGNRPVGFYIPRFQNLSVNDKPYRRGFGFQGISGRQLWNRGMSTQFAPMGRELKQELRKPGPWYMAMAGMGECLPYSTNRVTLDHSKTDSWGIPQLKIDFNWGDNERAMWADMQKEAQVTLEAAGADQIITSSAPMNPGGLAIHEMGTARMGKDPKTSVLNQHNQSHDIENLFITDGSCMTSSACQNPSLTYMALTARASEYAADRVLSGSL